MKHYVFLVAALLANVNFSYAQGREEADKSGEDAIALRYAQWAQRSIAEGRLAEAEAFLTRAADYANVSSDLSYQRAFVLYRLNRPKRNILFLINLAVVTDRFSIYTKDEARLLEARILIEMKQYNNALRLLLNLSPSEESVLLQLRAFYFSNDIKRFKEVMQTALSRYPYNPDFAVLFLQYAKNVPTPNNIKNTDNTDINLLDIILKRENSLRDFYPDMAYVAAPFMRDTEGARRYLEAYLAALDTVPQQALPVFLKLGVMDEETVIENLFYTGIKNDTRRLNKNVIEEIWQLIRTDDLRLRFKDGILKFTGSIQDDVNGDGIFETQTEYKDGLIQSFIQDDNQDGENEIVIAFKAGVPFSAEYLLQNGIENLQSEKYFISWLQYPAMRDAIIKDTHYFFRGGETFYQAVQFVDLCGPGGLLFPVHNRAAYLSETSIVSSAYYFERPGKEFANSIEKFECSRGIILSSKEYLKDKLVSVSEYKNGIKIKQNIDLDLDGRLETVRHFKNDSGLAVLDYIESDWDGDNSYEYRENF